MKKMLLMVMVLVLAMPMASAQNKALNKAMKKEYKAKMKEFKTEGWKLFASSRSLDVALLRHYEQLNEAGNQAYEVVGTAAKFKSNNVGHQVAINNACNIYSRQAGSHIKGRIVSDLANDGVDPLSEFDHFYAAYEALVEKEVKGEMKESFSVIRENKDGSYEMQSFFIVNEDAATQARIRAFENAAKESTAAQKYAQKVSDFVREGFKSEE